MCQNNEVTAECGCECECEYELGGPEGDAEPKALPVF